MASQFPSGFLIQTDAKLNSNKFNMTLSTLFEFANTISSFFVAYTFISSKYVED